MNAKVTVRAFTSLDNAALANCWTSLTPRSDTDEVFLTPGWMKAWWRSFGRGQALILLAERCGEPVALAPLFAASGMVYFIGSGGSDFLDFIGEVSDPAVLDALLAAARDGTPEFLGFLFYHVPDTSRTGGFLKGAAERLGFTLVDEGRMPAPAMSMAPDCEAATQAVKKKSLVRHENALRRTGDLGVRLIDSVAEIDTHLQVLFTQHISRWAQTPYPSLFIDPRQRDFYRRIAEAGLNEGWLRFTIIDWNAEPIAAHFGFHYNGRYLWYKPSFSIAHARQSPGEVLLRQLILAAMAEDAQVFDFGLGDEAFKQRFATHVRQVENWGLYPKPATTRKVSV